MAQTPTAHHTPKSRPTRYRFIDYNDPPVPETSPIPQSQLSPAKPYEDADWDMEDRMEELLEEHQGNPTPRRKRTNTSTQSGCSSKETTPAVKKTRTDNPSSKKKSNNKITTKNNSKNTTKNTTKNKNTQQSTNHNNNNQDNTTSDNNNNSNDDLARIPLEKFTPTKANINRWKEFIQHRIAKMKQPQEWHDEFHAICSEHKFFCNEDYTTMTKHEAVNNLANTLAQYVGKPG